MKKILVFIVIVLSVAIVVTGKLHWNDKIQATAKTAQVKKAEKVEVKTAAEEGQENRAKEVTAYSKNLPKEIQTKLISAVESGKPLNLVIAGSSATPEDPTGWPTLLKNELELTYGESVFNVAIKEIADKSSTEFVQEELYQEIINLSPDVLLLEPFILHDNGELIKMADRLANLTTIIEAIKKELPEVIVLLQPAYPIHNAKHYPIEVNELKSYAEESNIIYLNHWEAWPDYQSDEITEYLIDGEPNEDGHKLWADYLSNYFISKNVEK
ncbi:SGNH/GDSL hydrolase family protein [Fredinandcohnia salidurans]|uniref:SGNH/GDSL hydrolase family protein n=1 Tax=Fredinandcohnia salidurans TaxID=2595041 RepID=A0ABW4MR50_9BACI